MRVGGSCDDDIFYGYQLFSEASRKTTVIEKDLELEDADDD